MVVLFDVNRYRVRHSNGLFDGHVDRVGLGHRDRVRDCNRYLNRDLNWVRHRLLNGVRHWPVDMDGVRLEDMDRVRPVNWNSDGNLYWDRNVLNNRDSDGVRDSDGNLLGDCDGLNVRLADNGSVAAQSMAEAEVAAETEIRAVQAVVSESIAKIKKSPFVFLGVFCGLDLLGLSGLFSCYDREEGDEHDLLKVI